MLLRPQFSSRRRSTFGPQLCAFAAALLLLLSLTVLHSRLSAAPSLLSLPSVFPRPPFDPLDDRIDELDVLDEDAERSRLLGLAEEDEIVRTNDADANADADADSDESDLPLAPPSPSGLFWDHALGVARRPFGRPATGAWWGDDALPNELRQAERSRIAFGSDDEPVDEDVRLKLSLIKRIEDVLLLKVGGGGDSVLREGWARWLEGKGDFLRRDRMLRSDLELLNPKNHPLLQDPDGPALTALTKGDLLMQKALFKEMEKIPFVKGGARDVKGSERRSLHSDGKEEEKNEIAPKEREEREVGRNKMAVQKGDAEEKEIRDVTDGWRWGYFPGLDRHLKFSEFMDRFLGDGRCSMRIFMVWNSPPWTYGVRHKRGLESLLRHHKDACVVVFSETIELDFFREFVKDGFRVAVAVPNLGELLDDTPTHIFASVWFEWRKTKHYPIHYSELIRLAALYKYGGIYLDSDVIVLNPLQSLQNSVGVADIIDGNSTFTGAVMAFEKHSNFLMECLKEFYSTYDDTLLKYNGADLVTRVLNRFSTKADKGYGQLNIKIEPPFVFYPISPINITRYFAEPVDEFERVQQDGFYAKMMNESVTFHLWNSITSALVPEPNSLVDRILNHYCLYCRDVL
ncbi:uncharacterized protein At4g19900 [Ananas comosus]|uniref:Uncharacterized protein At4g19900 n=1 Tax=Ananas comosus TaxID=4615 RepID=A0A6P5GZ63_ANACO|nr:uncharacterized protein At4g19900 [Ananas comosus]